MEWCYNLLSNYGLAIILFTLLTKIIILPISVWVQKNSIKMVEMQPEINRIKAKYFGDADTIADEQSKLYKAKKYNPLASLIPLLIQIILLMGVVGVIYNPFDYLFHLDITAAVLSFLILGVMRLGSKNVTYARQPKTIVSACFVGVLLGIFQCLNTYAASVIDGTILYSSYNCGVSLLSTVTGRILFNEKLSVKQSASVLIGIVAIVLLCL